MPSQTLVMEFTYMYIYLVSQFLTSEPPCNHIIAEKYFQQCNVEGHLQCSTSQSRPFRALPVSNMAGRRIPSQARY